MSTAAEYHDAAAHGGDMRRRLQTSSTTRTEQRLNTKDASQLVRQLNADPKDKKTYGRTPDGTSTVASLPRTLPRGRVTVADVCRSGSLRRPHYP